MVEEVALGYVFFPEYFSFPCQFSFHQLIHILSSGAYMVSILRALLNNQLETRWENELAAGSFSIWWREEKS
jgi:hypothetical protein